MKIRILISALFLSLALFSCKNEAKEESEKSTEITQSVTFDILLDLKIKKDDDLIIYYKDGTNEWIVEEKAVWNSVKGSDEFQTVIFHMPDGVVPNDFRLDIGRNEFKNQEPIEIRRLTLSYLNNKFSVEEGQFDLFFKPNQYITFDEKTKQYSFSKDSLGSYDPYFETRPAFYPQLANMIK